MNKYKTESPILLLSFNRPEHTLKVFERIKEVQPPKLYISNDGPRPDHPTDKSRTQEIRDNLRSKVDWNCQVEVLFQAENLGCKRAVRQALSWFFSMEEQGIILEDDCVPNTSFFEFCDELLIRFKEDTEIAMISGNGRYGMWDNGKQSYNFISYPMVWGWASWRRTWKQYDSSFDQLPELQSSKLPGLTDSSLDAKRFWNNIIRNLKNMNSWAYPFSLLCLSKGWKCVVPQKNLIENIGFDESATHRHELDHFHAESISFPLIHPQDKRINRSIQNAIERAEFYRYSIIKRIALRLKRLIK